VDIPNVHAVQAGTFGRLFAAHGMRAGRGRQVLEVEMRIEGEQAVGNFRIQPGNIAGYGADLLKMRPDTIRTKADHLGDGLGRLIAVLTCTHFSNVSLCLQK